MKIRSKIVGVIGPNADKCSKEVFDFSCKLGSRLIDEGYKIVCGGRFGVMEGVCKGAHQSEKYREGCTIGILPSAEKQDANSFVDIAIPSGMGIARNSLVVNSADVIVAIAGGSGTLSELAFAWQLNKPVICIDRFEGWAQKLAGERIDDRNRVSFLNAQSVDEVINCLQSILISR